MAASNWCGLQMGIEFIVETSPKTILDVGIGFGKWGFLCRLYLDVYNHRWRRSDWQVELEGVEAFAGYIQRHQTHIYDKIIEQSIDDAIGQGRLRDHYDLVVAGDILEHIRKDRAIEVLEALRRCAGAILIGIPLGRGWRHREIERENPYEGHVSEWTLEDFGWADAKHVYAAPCKLDYGIITWRK